MELIALIYYRTMQISERNIATALRVQDRIRTVCRSVMTC